MKFKFSFLQFIYWQTGQNLLYCYDGGLIVPGTFLHDEWQEQQRFMEEVKYVG